MPLFTSVNESMEKLRSRMRAGEQNMTQEERSALGDISEYHAIATGFLQDAHENMNRSRQIGDMVEALPPEIRSILPDELKLEVVKQKALCEAWMSHAESFIYDDSVIESSMDVTDSVDDNVSSLIARAENRKASPEEVPKHDAVIVPFRR